MTIAFQSSRPTVCDCHKMKRYEKYAHLMGKYGSKIDPLISQSNPQQHHGNTVGSAAADRPGLTPSASTTQVRNTSISGSGGFGVKLGQQPTASTVSFEDTPASGQTVFRANLEQQPTASSVSFGDTPASSQSVFRANFEQQPTASRFSFGGPTASSQSGSMSGGTPKKKADDENSGLDGLGTSTRDQRTRAPDKNLQPGPPSTPEFTPFSHFSLRWTEIVDVVEEEVGTGTNGNKRQGDTSTKKGGEKKSKSSDELPQFAGKGLFQNAYKFHKDPSGKTGVTKTNADANQIWDSFKVRQKYFEKLATAFQKNNYDKGVKRDEWDEKRDALATRLSKLPNMFVVKEDEWQTPTESHDSLFRSLFK